MRRVFAWVWFIAVMVVLALSNPGPGVYQLWLQDRIGAQAGLGAPALNHLAGFIGGAVAAAPRYTTRSDLGLASVYTTQVNGSRITVLGVAGRFVLLRSK